MTRNLQERFDVVIVGSGPTGAAYARTIMDAAPHASVLVVEAGPVVADPPGLHTANIIDPAAREAAQIASQGPNRFAYPALTDEQRARETPEQRDESLLQRPGLFRVGSGDIYGDGFPAAQAANNVGGMGSHWFGACPRPSDTELIPFIEPNTLDSAYRVAESYLRASSTQFLGSAFAEHVQKVVGDVVNPGRPRDRWVQAMPMAIWQTERGVERCGPNEIFGDLLRGSNAGFELRPLTSARRVVTDGDRVTGVELRDETTGDTTIVEAGFVVVAGDSLRGPQLLFASGIRPDALGRNLNEHPQVSVLARVEGFESAAPRSREQGETATMADTSAVSVAASGVTWLPYDEVEFPFHGNLVQVDPASLPLSDGEERDLTPVLSVHLFLPQEPQWENRVEFSDTEVDWLGLPAMRMHLTLSERDRDVIARAKDAALRVSYALGHPDTDDEVWQLPAGSSLHYQGTLRMGESDDGRSVCDRTGRVWGFENLFVAGNGLIPTTTACNPTLTSVALAVIGASTIVDALPGQSIS